MEVIFIIWAVVSALIIGGSVFYAGYDKRDSFDTENFIFNSIFLAMLWPFLVFFVLCVAPFYGIYLLGKHLASRR